MFKNLLIVLIAIVILVAGWWIWRWESPPTDVNRAVIGEELLSDTTPVEGEVLMRVEKTDNTIAVVDNGPITIDAERSFFSFTGYAVGKSHLGTFTTMGATLRLTEDNIIGGTITIDAASLTSDGAMLENHLRSADFLNVEVYPTITFEGTLDTTGEAPMINGVLNFMGQQRTMSFPATVTDNLLEIDTIVDTSLFDMPSPGANPEVRIQGGLYWENQ